MRSTKLLSVLKSKIVDTVDWITIRASAMRIVSSVITAENLIISRLSVSQKTFDSIMFAGNLQGKISVLVTLYQIHQIMNIMMNSVSLFYNIIFV